MSIRWMCRKRHLTALAVEKVNRSKWLTSKHRNSCKNLSVAQPQWPFKYEIVTVKNCFTSIHPISCFSIFGWSIIDPGRLSKELEKIVIKYLRAYLYFLHLLLYSSNVFERKNTNDSQSSLGAFRCSGVSDPTIVSLSNSRSRVLACKSKTETKF